MTKIAIIPARGGSKRIPHKNIKIFLGKPILEYSIKAALKSCLFDEVMVSTDDFKIAELAKLAGASVPFFRSEINADDFASTENVILEVLEGYKKMGIEFSYLCCIYPTAPFIDHNKLVDSFGQMISKKADAVMSVTRFSYPIQRSIRITKEKYIEYIWAENIDKRSQDLEPVYHDAGQFYWETVDKFVKERKMILNKTIPFVLSNLEVQDIDNEDDWEIAEIKYKKINKLH